MAGFARFVLLFILSIGLSAWAQRPHWSEAEANRWYNHQPWLVGSNFIPADAINQLEMWEAASFDAREIDKELGWAEGLGMNTMRVFLHDLPWQQDAVGFTHRIDVFLSIAHKHQIRPVLVLFDSCWDPYPTSGVQHPPIPGVHNSGWVQSPGANALTHASQYPRLKQYVTGVIGAFVNDPRILAWDLWNEPDNINGGSYEKIEPGNKIELVDRLLPQVFKWARSVNPSQPLTSAVWKGNWSSGDKLNATERIQLDESDIISFHNYSWPEDFREHIAWLTHYHRPLVCSEYMARPLGSTFDAILPIAFKERVAAINWGFVAGKSQTYLPWDSWQRPYVLISPPVWFHDIYSSDGTPYRKFEVELVRQLTRAALPSTVQ
ncbi:MAG: cellulase family glycosylhydrolase [Acidobacteria bacterium]|nr:cellulase family glycosylhydrolase [Acidobacteriota bacterium]